MRASSQCSMAPEQHQEPTGTGAQRAQMAAILYDKEEDQLDELELALEKATGNYQEELKRSSAPVLPRSISMPVNFADAITNVRELLIPSVSPHCHEIIRSEGNVLWCMCKLQSRPRAGHDWPFQTSRVWSSGAKTPSAICDWSGMADHAPALSLDCRFKESIQPDLIRTSKDFIDQKRDENDVQKVWIQYAPALGLDCIFMASNAMSRIENQDGTCLVQILLSRTFLPWSFRTEKLKITLLASCSQKLTVCESYFKWFCTSLVKSLTFTFISPSSVLSSAPRGF